MAAPIALASCFPLFDDNDCNCPTDLSVCAETSCDGLACVITYRVGSWDEIDPEGDCHTVVCIGREEPLSFEDATDRSDDHNPCTVEGCGPNGPTQAQLPTGEACGDAGACSDGARCVPCSGDPCFDIDCDASPARVVALPPGTVCGDDQFCAPSGDCLPCDDGSSCTTEDCSSGAVVVKSQLPPGSPCDGGDYCSPSGACLICSDGNECTHDDCSSGTPVFTNEPFGTVCGSDDVCQDGACINFCTPLPDLDTCPDTGVYEATDDDWFGDPQFPDDDGAPRPICGVLTPGDVDWFSYYAQDEEFETDINDFKFWSFDKSLRVCAFEICDGGAAVTTASCENGGTPSLGPGNMPGCCWTDNFDTMDYFSMNLTCSNSADDSGWVHIRIDNPSGTGCAPYALLDYGY